MSLSAMPLPVPMLEHAVTFLQSNWHELASHKEIVNATRGFALRSKLSLEFNTTCAFSV
jgi:hypothetical protein